MSRLVLPVLALVASAPLAAADFNVTRFDDPSPNGCFVGDCSLREAVMAANALAGHDRIRLGAGVFNLTRLAGGVSNDERVGPLWISDDTGLVGAGSGVGQTQVRWSAAVVADSPVFRVWNQGVPVAVSWSAMRVTHGRGQGGSGGCFALTETYSTYTLERAIVRDCWSSYNGGGIALSQATLVLTSSTIESNEANNDGGGVHLGFDSNLITASARIRSNSAGRDGGGLAFTHHFLTGATTAFWTDNGRSSVTSNQAERNGGGVVVSGDTSLVLDGSDPDSNLRLNFGKNRAGTAGGAFSRGPRFVALVPPRMDLAQVSVTYNFAPIGGGVHAVLPVAIEDAEFRGNSTTDSATNGSGGGLYLAVANEESTIARSSFWLNDAGAAGGGAIYSLGCAPLTLDNVSIHDNNAARGAALGAYGPVALNHVTAIDNTGTSAELYQYYAPSGSGCGTTYAVAANSLLAERCSARYTSAGGNQYGPDALACTATANDARQASDASFGLAAGTYGGAFTVMGWNADASVRPQRDFGLPANCLASDARGQPRADGLCDAGAFEQQP